MTGATPFDAFDFNDTYEVTDRVNCSYAVQGVSNGGNGILSCSSGVWSFSVSIDGNNCASTTIPANEHGCPIPDTYTSVPSGDDPGGASVQYVLI